MGERDPILQGLNNIFYVFVVCVITRRQTPHLEGLNPVGLQSFLLVTQYNKPRIGAPTLEKAVEL